MGSGQPISFIINKKERRFEKFNLSSHPSCTIIFLPFSPSLVPPGSARMAKASFDRVLSPVFNNLSII